MGCGKMGRVGSNRKQGTWGGARGVTGGEMHEKEGWAGKEKEKEEEKVCVQLAYAQWLHFSAVDLSAAGLYLCIYAHMYTHTHTHTHTLTHTHTVAPLLGC